MAPGAPRSRPLAAILFFVLSTGTAFAQVDSADRQLLELGYDHPLSGAGPTAGYVFAYLNRPDFLRKGSTLRLAVAPVYVDGEYGIGQALGPRTDVGLGFSGGGFAQGHTEVRQGRYFREESFYGHGAAASVSVYHLFNPGRKIPLSGILRQGVQYSNFNRRRDTAASFVLPPNHNTFISRAGLKFGGELPLMPPSDALEVSTWYEGRFRVRSGRFGFSEDRELQSVSHLLWLKTVLVRVMPGSGRRFGLGLSAGTSVDADRLNGFGLGGYMPLTSDFPRNIPGYFHQELIARRFVLFSGQYGLPLDRAKRFLLNILASSALASDVPGLEQRSSHSGVGLGLQYDSPSHAWNALINYGYGIDAARSGSRGAHSVSLALQFDRLAKRRPEPPPLAPLPVFKH